jgi:hypothetical protein
MSDVYWIAAASLTVWIGLYLYLMRVDARLRELEKREG